MPLQLQLLQAMLKDVQKWLSGHAFLHAHTVAVSMSSEVDNASGDTQVLLLQSMR